MNRSQLDQPTSLKTQIKSAGNELRNYICELVKENRRLQKSIAKLEVKCVSQHNQIVALKQAAPKIIVNFNPFVKEVKKGTHRDS
jgi:hypothetical protein